MVYLRRFGFVLLPLYLLLPGYTLAGPRQWLERHVRSVSPRVEKWLKERESPSVKRTEAERGAIAHLRQTRVAREKRRQAVMERQEATNPGMRVGLEKAIDVDRKLRAGKEVSAQDLAEAKGSLEFIQKELWQRESERVSPELARSEVSPGLYVEAMKKSQVLQFKDRDKGLIQPFWDRLTWPQKMKVRLKNLGNFVKSFGQRKMSAKEYYERKAQEFQEVADWADAAKARGETRGLGLEVKKLRERLLSQDKIRGQQRKFNAYVRRLRTATPLSERTVAKGVSGHEAISNEADYSLIGNRQDLVKAAATEIVPTSQGFATRLDKLRRKMTGQGDIPPLDPKRIAEIYKKTYKKLAHDKVSKIPEVDGVSWQTFEAEFPAYAKAMVRWAKSVPEGVDFYNALDGIVLPEDRIKTLTQWSSALRSGKQPDDPAWNKFKRKTFEQAMFTTYLAYGPKY